MNIYYTAKDIEEMAAKGTTQLELGPGIFLTDFARETAQQLNITLVQAQKSTSTVSASQPPRNTTNISDKYNKPTGCQHGLGSLPATSSQEMNPSAQPVDGPSSNTVNRLIDLMGKAIKRGG